MAEIVIVGGGPIGLASAWMIAGRDTGAAVTVVDPVPGGGAASVAAGMLAPVTEAYFGEEPLLRLALTSAERWPSFAADVEEAAGEGIGYRRSSTLVVAYDGDDHAALERLYQFQRSLGLDVHRLRSREARQLEPAVAPVVRSGMLAGADHSVDPRRLCAALVTACERAGVTIVRDRVAAVSTAHGQMSGVTLNGGDVLTAASVVLAAGCWSASIDGLPPHARPPVRPVKGQVLTLRDPAGIPIVERNVRALVKGSSVYLVPRDDGRLVIGATMEEKGWDAHVTGGGLYELLRDATLLVPGVSELSYVEARAGFRPGSPDNAPIIGRGVVDGLVVATGHFRNGILLTPVTADAVASLVTSGEVPDVVAPFTPARFAGVAA